MGKQQLAYEFLPYNVDIFLELTMVTMGHDLYVLLEQNKKVHTWASNS